MKILHIIQTLNLKKGAGVTARNISLIKYLEKDDTENYIISSLDKDREFDFYLKKEKILFLSNFYFGKFPIPIPKIKKIINLIKKVDIVHMTNFWTILNIYIYIFCKIYSKKYVICPAGSYTIFGNSKLLKYIYRLFIGKKIIRDASAIISITEKEKKEFKRCGIPGKKIFTIPNGIELNNSIPSSNTLINEFEVYKPYILFVGRLNFIKGPDLLLKAFSEISNEFPEYKLLIAGPDEGMKKNLKKDIEKFKLDNRVLFLGFVNENRKIGLYKNASTLIIPSRSEAMSMVVLEAAQYGLFSIYTNVCGLEFLTKKRLGISVEINHKEISKAIKDFLNRSTVDYSSEELQKFVFNNFNWNLIAKKYIDLFKVICQKDKMKIL